MSSFTATLRLLVAVIFAVTLVAPGISSALPSGVVQDQTPPPPPPPPPPPVNPVTGPSQNGAAHQAQGQNKDSGAAAKAIGAMLMAMGAAMMAKPPTQPMGAMLMAMGALAMMQGGENDGAAGQHGFNSTLNQSSSGPVTPASDLGGNAGTLNPGSMLAKELKKSGGSFDPKTGKVTLPNGDSFNMKDVGNQGAMANAGVSSEDFKNAMKSAKDAEKKALADLEKAKSIENGFGLGGGGAVAGAPAPSAEDAAAAGGGPGGPRQPTSVAGMTRNYNGDMIGVAGDNIFLMMARRYKEKASKESFLNPEAKPVENVPL